MKKLLTILGVLALCILAAIGGAVLVIIVLYRIAS
jgi:hypothetical protein